MRRCIFLLCFAPVSSLTPFAHTRHFRDPRANATGIAVNSHGRLQSALPPPPHDETSTLHGHVEDVTLPQSRGSNSAHGSLWHHAVQGGVAGMVTGMLQVLCLMWLKTVMNHQYYHGGSLVETFHTLWAEGGVSRFYQGVGFALLQKPISRFGDAFMQSAALSLFGRPGQHLHGVSFGVMVATFGACWRLGTAPLDTWKVTAQVHGTLSQRIFAQRFRVSGLLDLWSGTLAMFILIWCSSLPWWTVYNSILEYWPQSLSTQMQILRNGVAGACASLIADIVSNSLRVLKVKRQAATKGSVGVEGYVDDAREIVLRDGFAGLFCRGLYARILWSDPGGLLFNCVELDASA